LWQDAARDEATGAPGGLGAAVCLGAAGRPGGGSSCCAETCDRTSVVASAAPILKGAMGIDVTGSLDLIQTRNIRKSRKRKSPDAGCNSLNFETMR
jgi:hypothetical protein